MSSINPEKMKYRLYEEFAGVCLDEKQCRELFSNSLYGKLKNLFVGFFDGRYEGEMVEIIARQKEDVFLHGRSTEDEYSSNLCYNAYFFYKNFIIVVPTVEKFSHYDDHNNHMHKISEFVANDHMPVVIPMCRLVDITTSVIDSTGGSSYRLILKFVNGKTVVITFIVTIYGSGTCGNASSWSFPVNKGLLGLKNEKSFAKENCEKVVSKVKELMQNCVDFDEVEEAIETCFKPAVVGEMVECMYDVQKLFNKIEINKSFCESTELINSAMDLFGNDELFKEIEETREKFVIAEKEYFNSSMFMRLIKFAPYDKLYCKLDDLNAKRNDLLIKSETKAYQLLLTYAGIEIKDREKKNIAKRFYEECLAKKVKAEENGNNIIFEMLYKKYEIANYDEAIKYYEEGRDQSEKGDRAKEKRKEDKERQVSITKYRDQKRQADIVGCDKYLETVIKEVKNAKWWQEATQTVSGLMAQRAETKAIKNDAVFFGGVANAIAGPAMGLATMAQIEAENRNAENEARQIRETSVEYMKQMTELGTQYGREIDQHSRIIERVLSKLCDIEHKNEYFKYLVCKVDSYKCLGKDVIVFDATIEMPEEVIINDIPFVLDGSLKVNIKLNGKVIGDAYINAPGYDTTDFRKIGFAVEKKYTADGVVEVEKAIQPEDKLEFEFEPYNLWIIEK